MYKQDFISLGVDVECLDAIKTNALGVDFTAVTCLMTDDAWCNHVL